MEHKSAYNSCCHGGNTGAYEPTADQIDVDNLTLDINTAMNGLVLYDTYNLALNNLLQARSLNISIYTLDSQTLYLSELERIEITLYNPTSGEAAIQTLITSISDADDLSKELDQFFEQHITRWENTPSPHRRSRSAGQTSPRARPYAPRSSSPIPRGRASLFTLARVTWGENDRFSRP